MTSSSKNISRFRSVNADLNLSLVKKYGDCIDVCFQVVILVNDGTHKFFTKVAPRQGLCDGTWHRIMGETIQITTQEPITRNNERLT